MHMCSCVTVRPGELAPKLTRSSCFPVVFSGDVPRLKRTRKLVGRFADQSIDEGGMLPHFPLPNKSAFNRSRLLQVDLQANLTGCSLQCHSRLFLSGGDILSEASLRRRFGTDCKE
ncbi:hypothetical protein MHYP_G00277840 [Metynnis hypsauchen]